MITDTDKTSDAPGKNRSVGTTHVEDVIKNLEGLKLDKF